jgi:hypothetical protein
MDNPLISICIPIYDMPNGDFFLKRCIDSIMEQTYKNYELVITKDGKMAENSNSAIKKAKGDLIKILYQDDYLAHKNSLQEIVDNFKGDWLVTGCEHDNGVRYRPHFPQYNDQIHLGQNTIGSPSVLTLRKGLNEYFDETMTWLLDCDLYKRLFDKYGEPDILDDVNVVIGCGLHQATHRMGDQVKEDEHLYIKQKYE